MSLAGGSKLGPYEIVAPVDVGGMGEVYRARDTRLERTVAVKILPAEFSADPVRKPMPDTHASFNQVFRLRRLALKSFGSA